MEFSRATVEEIGAVEELVVQCREVLTASGILQWDAEYPSRLFFQQAVAAGHLFVLTDEGVILGVVVLDEWQAAEWTTVTWHNQSGQFLVVHSLAVLPSAQGRGYGAALLSRCESFAQENGYTSMRLDAFSGNAAALRFYERHGYNFRGAIDLTFKPTGHRQYYCYEKVMKRS